MNELEAIGTTESGNTLLLFPSNGHLFYFEKIGWGEIRLNMVDTLAGSEQEHTEWATFEELPAPVRGAIVRSNYEMRSTKTTLEGAMS